MTDRLLSDQSLAAGSSLISPNGQHRLTMQEDGNLVIYRANGTPKWATGTKGLQIGSVIMQGDGNLVLYDPPLSGQAEHTVTKVPFLSYRTTVTL